MVSRLAVLVAAATLALAGMLGACGGKEVQYYRGRVEPGSESTPAPQATDPEEPAAGLPPSTPPSPPSPLPPPAVPCTASFSAHVAPIFVDRQCSNSNCHGGAVPRNLPRIDPTNLFATWAGLRSFTLSNGQAYVNVSDAKLSGMHCNLRGECGVAMPPMLDGNTLGVTEYAAIDAWLACGAPFN